MKKLKRLLSIALCFVLSLSVMASVIGCGNGGGDPNKTQLIFAIDGGGMGTEWAETAVERFEAKYAETKFEDGKTGVEVKIDPHTVNVETARNSAYDVYAFDHYALNYALASGINNGYLAKITDVVTDKSEMIDGVATSIEDKILEDHRATLKGNDGEYYAIPFYNFYPGLSYDVELFDKMGFYFAESSTGAVKFHSEILNQDFYFVQADETGNIENKSYGPDKELGGGDDGLPSTLQELVALCEYMRNGDTTVYPFLVAGKYPNMANFMLEAITTALQGYERAQAMYTLNGEIEVVTGFSNDPLFPGVDEIKKPITQKVVMTEECGYYASWAVEKYYSQAFMELAFLQDWWHPDSLIETASQKTAMLDFVFNGVEANSVLAGMLVEASFWYVEAEGSKIPQNYDGPAGPNHDGHAPRKIEFMPLPNNFDSTGTNDRQTFAEFSMTFLGINARITESGNKPDAGKLAAAKEFIKFLSSNEENINFNITTGLKKPLQYELPGSTTLKYHYYTKLEELLSKSDTLSFYADNNTFNQSVSIFQKGYFDKNYGAGGKDYYFAYLKDVNGANALSAFQQKAIEKGDWSTYYRGGGQITDYNGIVFNKK